LTSIDHSGLFRRHADYLWGLCYRLTGSSAEAEDLVQETFARALAQPPADLQRPWRPWLTTVATRLSIDALRRRSRRAYTGPWLPTPVETPEGSPYLQPIEPGPDAEVRYSTLESLSLGFLLALEVLTPTQRAVLLLRDAFGYTGPQTAEMLGRSPDNVRVLLHRARKAMAAARARTLEPEVVAGPAVQAAAMRFMAAVAQGDLAGAQACLTEDVVMHNDGGGEYLAALKPIRGRDKVARFHVGVAKNSRVLTAEFRAVNGAPALVCTLTAVRPRVAPRVVVAIELSDDGRIAAVMSMLAPAKLAAIRF
jgi:RNA polymerase sigma-70 factor (ECF subfamily)